jgi:crotonobetainyl-CoA:carnitine CoA-transferase CaiB-like acyl-CoA transferase
MIDITKEICRDLKVVDLSSILAGPLVGSFFAELSAKVIKVENKLTNGDATRQWKLPKEDKSRGFSAYYASANYGKEVHMLDLTLEEDKALVYRWIDEADVVITNFQKKVAQKLGFDPNDLLKIFPDVIIAQLSAYSYDDPRPGYDLVMQGETGWISMNGIDTTQLAKLPVALIDIIASHQMKEAILMALLHKYRTGKGSVVHVSLYDSSLTALVNQATNYLIEKHIAKPIGTLHPNIAPYGDLFETADDLRFMLAIGSDDQFEKLSKVIGLDRNFLEKFKFNIDRVSNRLSLKDVLQEIFAKEPLETWVETFSKNNLPFCQIRNLEEVFEASDSKRMVQNQAMEGQIVTTVKNHSFTIVTKD